MPDGPDPTAPTPDTQPDQAAEGLVKGTEEPVKDTEVSPVKKKPADDPSPPVNGTSTPSGAGQGKDTKGSPPKSSKEQSSEKKDGEKKEQSSDKKEEDGKERLIEKKGGNKKELSSDKKEGDGKEVLIEKKGGDSKNRSNDKKAEDGKERLIEKKGGDSKDRSSDKKDEDGKERLIERKGGDSKRRSRSPIDDRGDRHRRRKDDRSSRSTTRKDASPRRSSRRSSSRERSRRDRDRSRDRSRDRRRGRRSSRSTSRSRSRSHKRSRRSSERRRDRSSRSRRSRSRRSRTKSKSRSKSRRSRSASSKKSTSPSPLVRRPAPKQPEPTAPAPPSRPATLWDQPPPTPAPQMGFQQMGFQQQQQQQAPMAQQPNPLSAILASNPALAQLVGSLNANATQGLPPQANLLTSLLSMQQQQQQQQAPQPPVAAPLLINGIPVTAQQLRQARRLYVGNVPPQANEGTLIALFNQALVDCGKADPANPPVIAVQLELGKSFAFIELRSPEDASNALLFDGIALGPHFLKVRRPKDFKPLPGQAPDAPGGGVPVIRGVVSTTVPDSEHKVYLGGIPTALNEMQVRELVSAFGELKAFNLVRDASTNISKGYSFFEYWDHAVTDRVCAELNGFELGGRKLTCQRANTQVPRNQQALMGMGMNPLMTGLLQANMLGGAVPGAYGIPGLSLPGMPQAVAAAPPTRVIKLSNMVLPAELSDDNEYEEILSDIKDETSKYGTVLSLKIPRPTKQPDGQIVQGPGVGQVYVEFETVDGAKAAEAALRNRCFSGRTVVVAFYPEADYAQQNLK